ncbi:hypothetical protein H4219_002964 [Mycoemilia scoparia]|uniref:Uncharacterized protein n=1 Tax=Mycoemilia scoparia TaxID=417184 RepID=A0A9W7ZW58_9FUNG|nr:hypothetical protein H4219_002964 [Mycoemilia scoparia]
MTILIVVYYSLLTWVCGAVSANINGRCNSFVVLGDSISDTGRFRQTVIDTGISRDLYNKIGYWYGRYSNGPIWAEYAAAALNKTLQNFSYAGSSSVRENVTINQFDFELPGLHDQIHQVDDISGSCSSNIAAMSGGFNRKSGDVVTVSLGINDLLWKFERKPGNGTDSYHISGIGDAIVSGIDELEIKGYKDIVVFNIPAIAQSPFIALHMESDRSYKATIELIESFSPPVSIEEFVDSVIKQANKDIEQKVTLNEEKYRKNKTRVRIFDFYNVTKMSSDPAILKMLGISDISGSCIDENGMSLEWKSCPDPNHYYWYDTVHPNTRVQCFLGLVVAEFVASDHFTYSVERFTDIVEKYHLDVNRTGSGIFEKVFNDLSAIEKTRPVGPKDFHRFFQTLGINTDNIPEVFLPFFKYSFKKYQDFMTAPSPIDL